MIEIKGKTLPVIQIKIKEKGNIDKLLKELKEKLSHNIFKGSLIILENPEVLKPEERKKVEEILKEFSRGFIEGKKEGKEKREESRLLIIERTLRAGQRIEHRGDILILGDVNKDAEVLAGGNIIVMGKLRGVAKAGLIGDHSAVIVALKMEPQLLQIGKKKAIMSEADRNSPGYPEVAKIEGEDIVLEPIEGAERWLKLLL